MPFKLLLNRLLEDIPGAVGAIITDWEGEAVDQVARISEYEIKVLGAHKGIILNLLREALSRIDSGQLEEVLIRTQQGKTLIVPLNQDYFLVLSLRPEALAGRAAYKMHRCVAELRSEFD
jgi:predicted regulator of Ras-like GTPase activity (Roadblock/LC7/MglB family)